MSQFTKFEIEFGHGKKAIALKDVPADADIGAIAEALELAEFSGVITLVVAAGSMPAEIIDASRELFTKGLAPIAEKLCLLVVDGATRVGGVLAMGDAREAIGGRFPNLGVIPIGVIKVPDDLDPFHSHFVLVDGDRFGDESKILPSFLKLRQKKSAVIIVNCRVNSMYLSSEFPLHLAWAETIIPIRHSGGVADALLDEESELYQGLPESAKGKIKAVDLDKPEALAALLESLFV